MRRLAMTNALGFVFAFAVAALAQDRDCPPVASTYELIQRGIYDKHDCSLSYCHGSTETHAGMDLRTAVSYENTVNVPARTSPDGLMRILPGKPEQSFMWLTMAKRTLDLPDVPGEPMPVGRPRLSPEELEGYRLWIKAGAPRRGFVKGVEDLVDACQKSQEANDTYIPPCRPGDSKLLLPDIVVEEPTDIRIAYRSGSRRIGFTTSVANVGDGPLIIQAQNKPTKPSPTGPSQSVNAVQVIHRSDGTKCARPAGQLTFDPQIGYWAYGYMVEFELRKNNPYTGEVVARMTKDAYCLLDTDPMRGNANSPHQFEAHCTDSVGRMGISAGYKDVYHRVHPRQWLDLDADPKNPVDVGSYYLVNIANSSNLLWEKNGRQDDNLNYTRVSVRLPAGNTGGGPRPRPTRLSRPSRPASPSRVRAPRPPRPPRTVRPPKGPHANATPRR